MGLSEYMKSWIQVIEGMANDNTYKLAWGRAIIECALLEKHDSHDMDKLMDISQVVEKMLKYYWNQTFFFELKQGPNPIKEPKLYQYTQEAINHYLSITQLNSPVWFDRAESILKEDGHFYDALIKKMVRTAKQDVAYRFMNAHGKSYPLYFL